MMQLEGRKRYSISELGALSGISKSTVQRRLYALSEPYLYKRQVWLTREQFEAVTAPVTPCKEKHPLFQIAGKKHYANHALAAAAGVNQAAISGRLKAFPHCKYGKWTFLTEEEFKQATSPGRIRRKAGKSKDPKPAQPKPRPPQLSASMAQKHPGEKVIVSNEAGDSIVVAVPGVPAKQVTKRHNGLSKASGPITADRLACIKRRAREELEQELEAWGRLYDRFGEAHIRSMAKQGISPLGNKQGEQACKRF